MATRRGRKTAEQKRRSEAAKKGWVTRRRHQAEAAAAAAAKPKRKPRVKKGLPKLPKGFTELQTPLHPQEKFRKGGGRPPGAEGPSPVSGGVKRPKNASEAHDRLKAYLEEAVKRMASEGLEAKKRVFTNADGTVDGELVVNVPKNRTAREVTFRIEDHIRTGIPGVWQGVGFRFDARQAEQAETWREKDRYTRYRGGFQVQTYAQKRGEVAESFVTARENLLEPMRRHKIKKPNSIFVRFYWNPTGERPKRSKTGY